MLRVFDTKNNCWHHGEFCISANEDLMEIKKRPFGLEKIVLLSDERYAWHKDIGLYDSMGNLIFEGDVCEMNLPVNPDDPENNEYECSYYVVGYNYDNAAYYLVNVDDNSCCRFNKEVLQYLSVISNVFNINDINELKDIRDEDSSDESEELDSVMYEEE